MFIISWLRKFCRKTDQKETRERDLERYLDKKELEANSTPNFGQKFVQMCSTGQYTVKQLIDTYTPTIEEKVAGLTGSCKNGMTEMTSFLTKTYDYGIDALNSGLKLACENHRLGPCKVLIEKGASVIVGLRHAKSRNIINFLYKKKNENLNKKKND